MKPHYIPVWSVRRAVKFCSERFHSQQLHDEKYIRNVFEFAKSNDRPQRPRHTDK